MLGDAKGFVTSEIQLTVARALLPDDSEARHARLFDYFGGRKVSCSETRDGWLLTIGWEDRPDWHEDPNILKGLAWYSQGLTLADAPFAIRKEPGFQLALNDCWTLLAWSRWLSLARKRGGIPDEIVILHVDDHDDLMSPRVIKKDDCWIDAITRNEVDILRPNTIASAIISGAIGVGSFIVPLLHLVPRVHIRHCCVTGYSLTRRGTYNLQREVIGDDLLMPGASRQAVRLEPSPNNEHQVKPSGHSYSVASTTTEWLKDLPEAPIFLHIDLDFFNNRFNGDSHWHERPNRHDPSLADIVRSVDTIFNALFSSNVAQRIVDMAVGISPGFFPAELWGPTVDRIRAFARALPSASPTSIVADGSE